MSSFQIAIDGYSSTGKSTIAKKIAKDFNILYVDTGAMYRCVALFALENGFVSESNLDKIAIINALGHLTIDMTGDVISLNGEDVSTKIRTLEVANVVSKVSTIKEVRAFLVKQQQKMGESKSVVMDGRDIGSVVFPKAQLKLFITAKPKVRGERRYQELLNKNENVSFEEVLENLIKRDEIDSSRKESPLIECEDSVLIDNSNLDPKEQTAMINALIRSRFGIN
ncbi:MAG: (d)CMP kinase [Flavobacteriales bacterium]